MGFGLIGEHAAGLGREGQAFVLGVEGVQIRLETALQVGELFDRAQLV
jgi:hypothetical protein